MDIARGRRHDLSSMKLEQFSGPSPGSIYKVKAVDTETGLPQEVSTPGPSKLEPQVS